MVDALKAQGCDGLVPRCTELPLVLSDANAALPTLDDSTQLLARSALRQPVGGAGLRAL